MREPANGTHVDNLKPWTSALLLKLLSVWRPLCSSWNVVLAASLILTVVVLALFSSRIAPHDPLQQNLARGFLPPFWLSGGSLENVLGTDQLGRDILSRIVYGTRVSVLVGVLSVVLAGGVGVSVGLVSGYHGGLLDHIAMFIVDSQMAFPFILMAITIMAIFGPGLQNVILVLGLTGWVPYARLARSQVLVLREAEFVIAARSIGAGSMHILWRHILPNIIPLLVVLATLSMAQMIVVESSLSFLGFGVQPPMPSWGTMLSDGRQYVASCWWLATFPGAAIALTVLGISILGDWLRDTLDPASREM